MIRKHPGIIYTMVVFLLIPFFYSALFYLSINGNIHPLLIQLLGNLYCFISWYGICWYHACWLVKHTDKYFVDHPMDECPSLMDLFTGVRNAVC